MKKIFCIALVILSLIMLEIRHCFNIQKNKIDSLTDWFDNGKNFNVVSYRSCCIPFLADNVSSENVNNESKFRHHDMLLFKYRTPLYFNAEIGDPVITDPENLQNEFRTSPKLNEYANFPLVKPDSVFHGRTGKERFVISGIYDPDSALKGIGFNQRRDSFMHPEDTLVLKYLEVIQDVSSPGQDLLPSQEDDQAQTFNNSLVAIAFITKNKRSRAERILDYYANATDKKNTDITLQNFYYKGEARGFYQWVSLKTRHAPAGTVDRWIGDMAWLLIACKNYEHKYDSHRYNNLVKIIRDLLISFYKNADYGGYIQSGWRHGDSYLHESSGHHEGNIDCYVALKLCGENYYAQQIKIWLEHQLHDKINLPLDLYTWRVLAFGSKYAGLLNIPEYNFGYRKIISINGIMTMGFYSGYDYNTNNFWNDGTGHISCAFQAFGDKKRGYFYANQLDHLIIERVIHGHVTHSIPYVLNKSKGYEWVDTTKGFISCAAWYILAKNGVNPFMSGNFKDTVLSKSLTGAKNF